MLAEYYFKIKHVKGSDNAKINAFSRKEKQQNNNKVSGALLKLRENGKIQYNYLQLIGTHKTLKSL